jgi:hypothetical protein
MSQVWSIKIVSAGGTVRFDPDVFGIDPGQPLKAQEGDLVSWNNQTGGPQTVKVSKPGTDVPAFKTEIATFMSSSPGYVIQKEDIDETERSPGTIGNVCYEIDGSTVDGTIMVVES